MEQKIRMPYRGRGYESGMDLAPIIEMEIRPGEMFRIVQVAYDVKTVGREQPVPLPDHGIFKVEELMVPQKRVIVSCLGSDPESTGEMISQPELEDTRWDVRCEDLAPYVLFPKRMEEDPYEPLSKSSSDNAALNSVPRDERESSDDSQW